MSSLIHRSARSAICLCAGVIALMVQTACRRESGTVLGKAPAGQAYNVIAVRAGETPSKVTLTGVLVEKCPVAGCWFYLQDGTGTIKVDTKAAAFVVVDVPLQTKVTVSGAIKTEGEDVSVQATGLRY